MMAGKTDEELRAMVAAGQTSRSAARQADLAQAEIDRRAGTKSMRTKGGRDGAEWRQARQEEISDRRDDAAKRREDATKRDAKRRADMAKRDEKKQMEVGVPAVDTTHMQAPSPPAAPAAPKIRLRPGSRRATGKFATDHMSPIMRGRKAETMADQAMPSQVRPIKPAKPGRGRQGAFNAPPRKPGEEMPPRPGPIASYNGMNQKADTTEGARDRRLTRIRDNTTIGDYRTGGRVVKDAGEEMPPRPGPIDGAAQKGPRREAVGSRRYLLSVPRDRLREIAEDPKHPHREEAQRLLGHYESGQAKLPQKAKADDYAKLGPKSDGKYTVVMGGKIRGRHGTREDAIAQDQAINMSKLRAEGRQNDVPPAPKAWSDEARAASAAARQARSAGKNPDEVREAALRAASSNAHASGNHPAGHTYRISADTLRMPEAIANVMGGPSVADARAHADSLISGGGKGVSGLSREQAARSAGTDAGNRSMREGGRTTWSREDYAAATSEFNRVMGDKKALPMPDMSPGFSGVGVPTPDATSRGAYPFRKPVMSNQGRTDIEPTQSEITARKFSSIWDAAGVKTKDDGLDGESGF
jgi:hypothetical protein